MLTKTRIGNHLRRHMLGDQPTFRQGFKEGVEFAQKHAPASKPWVGLTNKDIYECEPKTDWYDSVEFAKAIEAKLREKNA